MRMMLVRRLTIFLFLLCLPTAVRAQEATAKLQEDVARNQEVAARNQEASARIAEETAGENPESRQRVLEASRRAQEAASRAQEAANKAQDAANNDAGSSVAQASASRAQDSANKAQEAANRAQEIANKILKTASGQERRAKAPPPQDATSPNVAAPSNSGESSATGSGDTATGISSSGAQAEDLNEFLNRRFDEAIKTRLGPKNNTNQSETPSINANSTSLVEKSSVSDLFSLAFNPSGTTASSSDDKPTSGSVTVSAYAFKAFASGRDPLDPAFYGPNRKWRKLSFTYGYDYTKGKEGDPREKGNIYGIKFLPYDKRDVSDPVNQTDIQKISALFNLSGPNAARTEKRIVQELMDAMAAKGKLPERVSSLKDDKDRFDEFKVFLSEQSNVESTLANALGGEAALLKLVDDIIAKNIDPEVKFTEAEQNAFDAIRRRPQIALVFLTKQRKETRPDEYMGGLTMDLGVVKRWNLTFNGMFNYTDNKTEGDSRGGTFSTEIQIPLNVVDQLKDSVPWTFSFGASGTWATKKGPMYQGQAKLTIPFPQLPGVELPISVSFANRSDLLIGKESKIKGKIGFTFDVAKLLAAFKNQLGLPPIQ